MGGGLALRLSRNHDVLVSSRNYEKAIQTAEMLETKASEYHKNSMIGSINGSSGKEAIEQSEIVIITVPAESSLSLMHELRAYFRQDQTVISPVVSMKKNQGIFRHIPLSGTLTSRNVETVEQKSAAELIQEIVSPARVVSAFHTVPAAYLTDFEKILELDVFVAGDEDLAVNTVSELICEIPKLRPLKACPLENSRLIEAMVPLLLNVAMLNSLKEPSIRVVPWISTAYDGCT